MVDHSLGAIGLHCLNRQYLSASGSFGLTLEKADLG